MTMMTMIMMMMTMMMMIMKMMIMMTMIMMMMMNSGVEHESNHRKAAEILRAAPP